MKKLISLVFVALALIISGCEEDNPFEDYQGSYSGTYTGGDTGNWNVTIDDAGKVSGTVVSDTVPTFPFSLSGNISKSGSLSSQVNLVLGTLDFNGQINGSNASGTWTNADSQISGTWTGTRN